MEWEIIAIVFIALFTILGIILSVSILIYYKKGYNFGNSLSKDAIKRFREICDENVKLKERDAVLTPIAMEAYEKEKEKVFQEKKDEWENLEDFQNEAKKRAFREYDDIFKKDIEKHENITNETFANKNIT